MTSTLTRTAAALAVAALPLIAGGTAQAGQSPSGHPRDGYGSSNHDGRDRGDDFCHKDKRQDPKGTDYRRTDERTRGNGFEDPPARMTIPRYGDNCQTHKPPEHKPPRHDPPKQHRHHDDRYRHHHKRNHVVKTDPWNEVRTATAAFFSVKAAENAGYARPAAPAPLHGCIAQDPKSNKAPAMGFHWINGKLLDAKVEATKPEALVYEPNKDGKLDLVAVEYVVFKSDWEKAGNLTPPKLNGVEFMLTTSPNRYGIPAFYSLHAWIWKSNPDGLNEPFNPRVSCVYAGLIK